MKKQLVIAGFSILLALGATAPAAAADRPEADSSGFYGGISMRDQGKESAGVNFGAPALTLTKFATPTADDSAARALLFGGYRWSNDIAVEAAFSSSDKYALHQSDSLAGRRGVGLNLTPSAASLSDLQSKTWNVDVYTSWSFRKSFALYGRLGYAQSEIVPLFAPPGAFGVDGRRLRDGVTYGVGLRYDMNPALGLRVEYGRFGRFAGEYGAGAAESDQVTVGVQLQF